MLVIFKWNVWRTCLAGLGFHFEPENKNHLGSWIFPDAKGSPCLSLFLIGLQSHRVFLEGAPLLASSIACEKLIHLCFSIYLLAFFEVFLPRLTFIVRKGGLYPFSERTSAFTRPWYSVWCKLNPYLAFKVFSPGKACENISIFMSARGLCCAKISVLCK